MPDDEGPQVEVECANCGAAIRVRITRENPKVVRCACGNEVRVTTGGQSAVEAGEVLRQVVDRIKKESWRE